MFFSNIAPPPLGTLLRGDCVVGMLRLHLAKLIKRHLMRIGCLHTYTKAISLQVFKYIHVYAPLQLRTLSYMLSDC